MTGQGSELWSLEEAIEYAFSSGRVCPMPVEWDRLFQVLKHAPDGRKPKRPLILAAWHVPSSDKSERFKEHIEWAFEYGDLQRFISIMKKIPDEKWSDY